MPTKARGPLQEDYVRALRAAKKMGAKAVVVHLAGTPIVIPLDDAYLSKLGPAQPPSPSSVMTEEERRKLDLEL